MPILAQLSSQVGDRTEASNRKAALQCLGDPALLAEIAEGLARKNAALAGDCAEVMTQVAEQRPAWVAPYVNALAALLKHKTTRVRWETAHAIAFVAASTPETIHALFPTLTEIILHDPSIIVRDYAVDAIGNYAAVDKLAAQEASPALKEALSVWGGRHAGHALLGLANAAPHLPDLSDDLRATAEAYLHSEQGIVRKAAKKLYSAAAGGL